MSEEGVAGSQDTPHARVAVYKRLDTCLDFCSAFASAGRVIEGRGQLLRCLEHTTMPERAGLVIDIEVYAAIQSRLSEAADMLQMSGRAIQHKSREVELQLERWAATRLQAPEGVP